MARRGRGGAREWSAVFAARRKRSETDFGRKRGPRGNPAERFPWGRGGAREWSAVFAARRKRSETDFAPTTDIQDQRDRGETDENLIRTKAALYAVGNGLLNAAVEMGGGIQTLPAQLQGGKSAWRAWVEGMVDEGKEEVVQGILQRSLQNAIYQQDNPLFSTTDEGAILNPKTAAEEFAGGAAVGGILGGGQALILSRRAARPAEEYLTEREGILRDLATQKVQGEMELARRRAAPRELIRPETARELLATLGERGERAFRAAYQQESGLLPSFREFAKAYNQGLRGEPKTAVEPGRSIDTMAGYFAGQNDAAAQSAARLQTQKTAPTREAGTYRAVRPQNVELPTVPIISLSMQDVADMNGGVLPQTGNTLRKTAYDTTLRRLGLDHNEAVYIEASNVTRNGDSYVIKITKPSLKKMLSASSYANRTVPLESLAVLNQIERIAQNGVYFNSEGDRKGRLQIAGYDHLLTTVYLDGVPYVVDMRVRVEDEQTGGMNRLYHFTPEVISVTKKKDGTTSAAGRHATSVHSSDAAPSSVPIIAQTADGGNTISAQGQEVNPESGGQIDEPAAVEPGRSIDTMAGYFAGQNDAAAQSAARLQTQKTAPTGRAGTGLVPLTEQDEVRLSTGKNNIIARTFQDIVSFVKRARSKKGGSERLYMGTIPDSAAELIRSKTGINVFGYTAILPGDSVQHIFKNHGTASTENSRGQRAVTENDIALIPEVLSSPDRVSLSQDTDVLGRSVLLLEKQIGDTYVTAQAVTDGRHALTTNSLWIQKKKNRPTIPDAGMTPSPEGNARSALSQGSSGTIIPKDGQEVNPENSGQIDEPAAVEPGRSDALGVPEQDAAMGAKEAPLTVGRRMTEAERAELEALHAREDSLTREEKARYRELLSRRIEEALYWGGTEP